MDFQQSTKVLKKFCDKVDDQICNLIVILHDDKAWIGRVHSAFENKNQLKIFSDKKRFFDFVKVNAFSKLFVDISKRDHLALIQELRPIRYSGDLYFTSDLDPNQEQIMTIHQMGGEFLNKRKALDNILSGGVDRGN